MDDPREPLLPAPSPQHQGRPTLLLDLDNTLIKSSLYDLNQADFHFRTIDSYWHATKRPFVDDFLSIMATLYELVVFTASRSEYANSALNQLDRGCHIVHRLYVTSCETEWDPELRATVNVKDLRNLGRDLKRVVALDDDPLYYSPTPQNVIAIPRFEGDRSDTELLKVTGLLQSLAHEENIPLALQRHKEANSIARLQQRTLLHAGADTREQTSAEDNTVEYTKTGNVTCVGSEREDTDGAVA